MLILSGAERGEGGERTRADSCEADPPLSGQPEIGFCGGRRLRTIVSQTWEKEGSPAPCEGEKVHRDGPSP